MKRRKKSASRQSAARTVGQSPTQWPAAEIYSDESAMGELYVCRNYPWLQVLCPACPSTRLPMGPLANGDLRHPADWWPIVDFLTRSEDSGNVLPTGGRRMADFFCISLRDAHISQFSEYRCKQLIEKCESILQQQVRAS